MKLIKFSIIALILTCSMQFAQAQVRVGVGVNIGHPYHRVVVRNRYHGYYARPAYYPRTVVYRGGYRRPYYGRPSYRRVSYRPAYRGRGYYHGRGHGWHR